ncbi:MAG: GNAT family N-acetyltransferase [Pseudomonadota bacterium]
MRPLRREDAQAVTRAMQDRNVVRMLTAPPHPYLPEHAEEFLARAKDAPFAWAITLDGLLGAVDIADHLGYWLAPPAWGQGIMTRAARAAVDHYFSTTQAETLVSGHLFDNPASGRVLANLGFEVSGQSQVHVKSRGGLVQHVDMSLARAAWETGATALDHGDL